MSATRKRYSFRLPRTFFTSPLKAGQPSPTGRFTFTSWRLWKKDDPLVESGLLGPVTLQSGK